MTRCAKLGRSTASLLIALSLSATAGAAWSQVKLAPASMPAIAKVDRRYQSYNVEMAEVIGGRFWAPYAKPGAPAGKPDGAKSGGVDLAAGMFRKREPLDLRGNRRLRNLAKALGPAYVRIGGAWANTAYFQDDDGPAQQTPPGFQGVLTRAEWAGVIEFAKATDSKIVTSFGVSPGARDASGGWNPDDASKLVRFTRSLGGKIYAAELINEPNVGPMVGLPKGYDANAFARDDAIFRAFLKQETPDTKSVGPASTGEAGFMLFPKAPGTVDTASLMSAEPKPQFDIFAYHFYGAASQRCAAMGKDAGIAPSQALSEEWLARTDQAYDYYKALHDRFTPGAPIWITEAAEAGCGGDLWAATYLDTFRYVDQLGRLARRNVAAVFHNTLAASDYALVDDQTWRPRPSYWAALLWRRLMGEVVLDAGPIRPGLHVYAQCLRGHPGGVAVVAINLDREKPSVIELPTAALRYTLTADELQSGAVKLNGRELALTNDDQIPSLHAAPVAKGELQLAPASITFLAVEKAGNPACRAGAE
jgi:hypothetical protein